MAVLAKVVADATIGISYERLDEGRASTARRAATDARRGTTSVIDAT